MTVPVVRFVAAGREPLGTDGPLRSYTLVYDGQCKVCQRSVAVLRKWDKKQCVEAVPSQHPGVPARFPWIPTGAYADAVQLIGPGGRTWQGAQAIEHLLDVLPRGWLVGWVFKLPFMGRVADRLYRWFARNRYKFGCSEHCQMRPEQLDFSVEGSGSTVPGRPAKLHEETDR